MLKEKDMEDAIARNPEEFLEEPGLSLVARQHRMGNYIFDLLFEDRHGGMLIVEVQRGTLDRAHTYKILDYYHEYRERFPAEFIDLMVVANCIPAERKKRLRDLGVAFRELGEARFGGEVEPQPRTLPSAGPPARQAPAPRAPGVDPVKQQAFDLFFEVKERFLEALTSTYPGTRVTMDFKTMKPENIEGRKNWFVCWVPPEWGTWSGSVGGVHCELCSCRERRSGREMLRFNVGVEKPLQAEFRSDFKKAVSEHARAQNLVPGGIEIWPCCDPKLLNAYWPISGDSWQTALSAYNDLQGVIAHTGEVLRRFAARDAFSCELSFPG